MSLQFRLLVLRLLLAIYKHQLATLRIVSENQRGLVFETDEFINDLISKEDSK